MTSVASYAKRQDRLISLISRLKDRGWSPGEAAGWGEEETRRWYTKILNADCRGDNLLLSCVSAELLYSQRPDTVRGNMYMVVSSGWLPDTSDKSYNRIQRLLNRLRMNRTVPFEWVTDNVRATIKPSSWSGLADFTETVRDAYRKDFWHYLPEYIEVIVEKDAVAGRVQSVTEEYDVRLHPIRGYNSTSFAWEIARYWKRIEKPITVYYIGDHDPSGRDLERDIREKAFELSGKEVTWKRLAVEPEHFERFNIIPLEPKALDKRTPGFIRQYGKRCAEVEGVPANDLRQMLTDAIVSHIPAAEWKKLQRIENLERQQFQEVMARLSPTDDASEDDSE